MHLATSYLGGKSWIGSSEMKFTSSLNRSIKQTPREHYIQIWPSMLSISWRQETNSSSDPHTHLNSGWNFFAFPWASSMWAHIDYGLRQITTLPKQKIFSKCPIFERSRQRNTWSSTAPCIKIFVGNYIVYFEELTPSPLSPSTSTSYA